jgi:recombination protein RecA
MTTTEEVLARLDKKTRERLLAASEVEVEFLRTPSIGLNIAMGGGFGYGRQSLIWGNKSAGKTSMCLQIVGLAQKEGKSCAWIDSEKSFDPDWATRLGVDTKDLIIEQSPSIAKVADDGVKLIGAGIDVLVVDSITTMLSSSYFNEGEMKDFDKTGQIGQESKDLGKMQKMWMAENDNTAIILISQQRNKISPTYTQLKPTGGEATIFNSSTVVKLFSTESDAKAIMDDVSVGDKIYREKVGRPVNWEVEFNKLAPMGLTGKYDFYFRGDNVGVDFVGETVELAERYGIIKKSGGWYAYEGKSYYLKDLAALLRDDAVARQKLLDAIYVYI